MREVSDGDREAPALRRLNANGAHGELDIATADELRQVGLELIAADGCTEFVIDMMDVPFMDSSGFAALIAMRNAAKADGTPLALLDPYPQVQHLLEITALVDVFDIRRS